MTDPLEIFWDAILSREPAKISAAYRSLAPQERMDTWAHLTKMITEEGWHPEQRLSAETALQTIQNFFGIPTRNA